MFLLPVGLVQDFQFQVDLRYCWICQNCIRIGSAFDGSPVSREVLNTHALNNHTSLPHMPLITHIRCFQLQHFPPDTRQFDGFVEERHTSSALAMELRLSCTNPSINYISSCIVWHICSKWIHVIYLSIFFRLDCLRLWLIDYHQDKTNANYHGDGDC